MSSRHRLVWRRPTWPIAFLALTSNAIAGEPGSTVAGAECAPVPATSLAVTLRPQETGMWCWAASGEMVMEYLGRAVSQCTQANDEFGRTNLSDTVATEFKRMR